MTSEEKTKLAARIYKVFASEYLVVENTQMYNEQLYTEILEQIEEILNDA